MNAKRPDTPEWSAAKAKGDRAETRLADWFAERGYEVTRSHGQAAYDLLLLSRVEVKSDLLASETGCVAFEVACNGQPSGIRTTAANWWAIVIGDEVFIARTRQLRDQVLSGTFREVPGGHGMRTRLRLVPRQTLENMRGIFRLKLEPAA